MLIMPIIVVFFQENGLSMKDVFILQAIYSIAIVALEIPSGYFADVWGRKNTLIAGAIFGFLGYGVYTVSYGFWGFLLAELTMGIGQSFISGADSALLYDTLSDSRLEKKYIRYEGRFVSVGNFAEALAGILGGLLAGIHLRVPFYAQAFVALMAIPAAILIREPSRFKQHNKMTLRNILQVVKYALVENKVLRYAIGFSAIIGTSTLTMAWFVQPYFKEIELPLGLYGVFWTCLTLRVGLTAMLSYKAERLLGQKKMIVFISLAIPLGYLFTGLFQSYWALVFLFLFYAVRGIATPVLKDYIHRLTTSNVRATVLSIRNFIIRLVFSLVGPLLGWYTDLYTLPSALLLAAILFFSFALLTSILYLYSLKNTRED